MSVSSLVDRLKTTQVGPYTPAPVAADVTKDQIVYLKEHPEQFPGVSYAEEPLRDYPNGTLAVHALGIVGQISADQVNKSRYQGYSPGSVIGRGGIEYAYERYLHGTDGYKKLQVDANGNVRSILATQDPKTGSDVVTTLDQSIQTVVEQSLAQGIDRARLVYDKTSNRDYAAPAGGAVVMDPSNGQILAMASYPTYNPGQFAVGISQAAYDAQFKNNAAQPLIDRVIQAQYPPGSTFKIVPAAAALTDGIAQGAAFVPYNQPGFAANTLLSGSMTTPVTLEPATQEATA